jgi:hypothetical protein
MAKYFLPCFFILMATSGFSQSTFKRNDLYFELIGNGIGASLNYERQLGDKPGAGVRVGLGYFSGDEKFRFSFPFGIHYLFQLKKDKSFIDAGLGATYSATAGMKLFEQGLPDYEEHIWSFVPSVGYRHHTKANFLWRISLTPIMNKYRLLPFPGLSIGKRF